MQFNFGIPSFVTFGAGSINGLGDIAGQLGGKKALFVCDQGIKDAGIAKIAIGHLKSAGVEVTEFDRVLPNPPDYIAEEGAQLARNAGVDFIVAAGGGSVLDCAKAINILLTNPSPINQYAGLNMVKNPVKPLICLPTTSGTASEVTAFSIITDTQVLKKMVIGGQFVGANFALADPELTAGMPPALTASTGMDALTHAIEAYLSKGASVPTDVNALKAIEIINANLVEATNNGKNMEARANMLLGSILAGFAFNSAVLGLVHSIAHPLSVHCGLAHGIANASVLPYVMEFNSEKVPHRTGDIAQAMGLDVQGISKQEAAAKAVKAVMELSQKLKIPGLQELGVEEAQLGKIAEDALEELSTQFNPREATREELMNILKKAY